MNYEKGKYYEFDLTPSTRTHVIVHYLGNNKDVVVWSGSEIHEVGDLGRAFNVSWTPLNTFNSIHEVDARIKQIEQGEQKDEGFKPGRFVVTNSDDRNKGVKTFVKVLRVNNDGTFKGNVIAGSVLYNTWFDDNWDCSCFEITTEQEALKILTGKDWVEIAEETDKAVDIIALTAQRNAYKEDIESWRRVGEKLNNKIEVLQEELRLMTEEKDLGLRAIDGFTTQIKNLRNANTESHQQNKLLLEAGDCHTANAKEMNEKIKELKEEVKRLTDLSYKRRDDREKAYTEIESLKKLVKKAQSMQAIEKRNIRAQEENHRLEKENWKSEIDELQTEIQEGKDKYELLDKDFDNYKISISLNDSEIRSTLKVCYQDAFDRGKRSKFELEENNKLLMDISFDNFMKELTKASDG